MPEVKFRTQGLTITQTFVNFIVLSLDTGDSNGRSLARISSLRSFSTDLNQSSILKRSKTDRISLIQHKFVVEIQVHQ